MNAPSWKESVIYQIYPQSFKDSNGDGWGDLQGIISKIDYLVKLGVDIVWLGPICESPMVDNGYDISDYQQIHPRYGTMEDFEQLLSKLHENGIKLIMDLVINHTSDEHPWFQQAQSSKDSPYRDYYIWKEPGSDGQEPNNWMSFLNEPAWTRDEQSGEYYLHLFDRKQPDLNWENENMRQELYTMIRWWLDKGIDGFRLDAINMISKDPELPDAPADAPHPPGQEFYKNGPRIHEFLQEMYEQTFSRYPEVITLGEAPSVTMEEVVRYTAPERQEMNMVLAMDLIRIGKDPKNPWGSREWSIRELKESVSNWYSGVFGQGGYALYLSTHDHPRIIPDLIGTGEYEVTAAKLIATFLHTIPGTPLIYQGEELGLGNTNYDRIEDYRDAGTLAYYQQALQDGLSPEQALANIHRRSRDGARSPIPWDDSNEYAGFSTAEPWMSLPPADQIEGKRVSEQENHPDSVFYYYRQLIQMRKQNPIMSYGSFQLLLPEHEEIFAFIREWEDEKWLVVLNFADREVDIDWSGEGVEWADHMIKLHGNYTKFSRPVVREDEHTIEELKHLRPYEALIYRM
ncbi:glycoside hydrolase family 13 protein [Paenibacillus shenyangensis]|uniref:glycoside hydrolase family 13 protein n=1 Tax=Paenibacillus sp. A9 TaxID=1284352 RepID=UPI00035D67B1|nr:alpha-glucosidase [Paenibacillus sp. A9]